MMIIRVIKKDLFLQDFNVGHILKLKILFSISI